MPLGLLALIAVGIHAAADAVDDRLLWLIDRADATFDAWVSRWDFTKPMVDWVGAPERLLVARSLALAWELAADLVLALPALGYEEHPAPPPWPRVVPTVRAWVRPLCTFFVVLAGASAVARMVQGAVFLSLHSLLGNGVSGALARAAALGALGAVTFSLGGRAVLRTYEDARQSVHAPRAWVGTLLVAPLALAAAWDATPLLAFVR